MNTQNQIHRVNIDTETDSLGEPIDHSDKNHNEEPRVRFMDDVHDISESEYSDEEYEDYSDDDFIQARAKGYVNARDNVDQNKLNKDTSRSKNSRSKQFSQQIIEMTDNQIKTQHFMGSTNVDHIDIDDKKAEDTVDILNVFNRLYNAKNLTIGSMFQDVDIKDPHSTNNKMEEFYEHMQHHMMLLTEDSSAGDVYGPFDKIENKNDHEVYAIVIGASGEIKYKSLSYISLLKVGADNIKKLGSKWNIIRLSD